MSGYGTASARRLICEGWLEPWCESDGDDGSLVMHPTTAYVEQGSKVWVAFGEHRIDESSDKVLVENFEDLELEERHVGDKVLQVPKGGRWVVEGPFQRSDVENANKRRYPRAIWERLIGDDKSYVQQNIRDRAMVGHLEHPADGRTDGAKGAIVVTKATLEKDGTVMGAAEILDTPHGLILQEYTRKQVRWGVSSRGNGSIKDDGTVDPDHYVLETWDAVMKPSVKGAFPSVKDGSTKEGVEEHSGGENADGGTVTEANEFATQVGDLVDREVEGLDESGRAELHQKLIDAMGRGNALSDAGRLSDEDYRLLQGWLTTKLAESMGVRDEELGDAVDEAIRAAQEAEGEDRRDGFDRVTESLKARLSDALAEAEALRERLEAAESRATGAEGQLSVAVEQLSEAEGRVDDLTRRLKLAEDLLASQPASQGNGLVAGAVDEAISEVPELEPYRSLLERGETAEDVRRIAEQLLPRAVTATGEPEDVPRPSGKSLAERSTLPRGVKVKSETAAGDPPPVDEGETPSRGASVAGQAVSIMESRSADSASR